MRVPILVVGVLASTVVAGGAVSAQDAPAMTPTELAAACAPPAATTHETHHALRIVGAQDTMPRTIFGPRDLLVVRGGTDAGVQLGAEFFVRRTPISRSISGKPVESDVITDGWVQIVAVNDTTSIARVEKSCGAIFADDFLEPFAAVAMPAVAAAPLEADFTGMARVLAGEDRHYMAGINQFAILDRGSEQGVRPGARFAVYRDLTIGDPVLAAPSGTPLTPIGELVVLTTTGNRAVAKVVRARDAVFAGDYAAPQKK